MEGEFPERIGCNKFMLVKLFGLGVGACGLKKELEVVCTTDCVFVLTVQNKVLLSVDCIFTL